MINPTVANFDSLPVYVVYKLDNHANNHRFIVKGSATKLFNRMQRTQPGQWAKTTKEDFEQNVVVMRKVRNIMTGEMVDERSDTPYYLSVASETYWSR